MIVAKIISANFRHLPLLRPARTGGNSYKAATASRRMIATGENKPPVERG